MSTQRSLDALACHDRNHCITCSDEGTPMRVLSCDAAFDIAACADEGGVESEVMTALVNDVLIGDLLLVHAGTALTRLSPR